MRALSLCTNPYGNDKSLAPSSEKLKMTLPRVQNASARAELSDWSSQRSIPCCPTCGLFRNRELGQLRVWSNTYGSRQTTKNDHRFQDLQRGLLMQITSCLGPGIFHRQTVEGLVTNVVGIGGWRPQSRCRRPL